MQVSLQQQLKSPGVSRTSSTGWAQVLAGKSDSITELNCGSEETGEMAELNSGSEVTSGDDRAELWIRGKRGDDSITLDQT